MEKESDRRPRILVAAAGAVGAVALPGWHVGVGWFAMGAVVAVAAVVGGGRSGPIGGTREDRIWRAAAGLAALTLAAIPALRAAGWLAAVCLLAAAPLASYSLVGGAGWRALGLSTVALPRAVPAAVGWLAAAPAERPATGQWRRVLGGTGAGIVLVLVFGLLFRAADPRFADLVSHWTGQIRPDSVVRFLGGFVLVGLLAAGAAYLVHKGQRVDAPAFAAVGPRLSTVEWAVPVGMLIALFATFVRLQLDSLFGGRAYVMNPSGPDFAEYARTGFVLLVVVTVLTLAVVAALALLADRSRRGDRILLRVLGGALCVLTLVIVASALDRMAVYAGAYGYTGQRLAGYAVEVWLGLLFVLVLAAGWRLRAAWLPRAVVGAAVAVLLGVVAVNPDALMARTHADRTRQAYPLDYAFLGGLSADAAGELAKLPPEHRRCLLDRMASTMEWDVPWYRFNVAERRARALRERTEVTDLCG